MEHVVSENAARPERQELDLELLQIRGLEEADRETITDFQSGDDSIDAYLKTQALEQQRERFAMTHLAMYGGELVGYITLVAQSVRLKPHQRAALGWETPYPEVPALFIARLGADESFASEYRGVGTELVHFAYRKAHKLSLEAGCRLLVLQSEPDAIGFYDKLEFNYVFHKEEGKAERPWMYLDMLAPEPPRWASASRRDGEATEARRDDDEGEGPASE